MKRSVIVTDRLGPDILSAFWTKGQVLLRERAHLKVPGFSIVLYVLLTRKLPTFLSRLNEISGGCEKIAPVSLRLAELVLRLNCFSFAGNYYKQINGVAMGTKMGPSYANLFVGYVEHQFFLTLTLTLNPKP